MLPIMMKLKEDNKNKVGSKKPIIYSRILTNRMTIVAWKLFKKDRKLHYAFLLYRLKRDFGFTNWELANFTGMPMDHVNNHLRVIKPIIKSGILKILAKMDDENELREWKEVKHNGKEQGYYIVKEYPAWYEKPKRITEKPYFQLGSETEKELDELLQNRFDKLRKKDAKKSSK